MALLANLPIALAPTMGTNTYFSVIVCIGMGLKWQEALALTFYNGVFFFIISIPDLSYFQILTSFQLLDFESTAHMIGMSQIFEL